MLIGCRIPNLPFFYLVYRTWSHWKAQAGGKHIQWLVQNKLLTPAPSPILDELYEKAPAQTSEGVEQPLLSHDSIRSFSEKLCLPELETELDRAIWQVAKARDAELAKEKAKVQSEKSDEDKKDK